jgi:GGDEF domain-containing protein
MGDAFVLVLGGFSPRDLAEKQRRIESRLEELGVAGSGEHRLAVKVGAAFYPADGADAGELLAAADARLRLARQGGADRFATELAELGGALEDPRVRGEQARRVPR